jgi:hypothetical protein
MKAGLMTVLATAALAVAVISANPGRLLSDERAKAPHDSVAAVANAAPFAIGFASHSLTEAELGEMSLAGATFVRTDFAMASVQPNSSNSYDWKELDAKVAAATAHGLRVLGILDYSPQWNAHTGCVAGSPNQCAPADIAAFASYAAAAARHFPNVKHWEIWNEPNLVKFWGPAPNVADYVKMLNSAFAAIKAVAPDDVVLAGALSRADDRPGVEISPTTFAASMYAEKADFDILSLHPYTYPFSPDTANTGNGWLEVAAIRDLMIANGDADKKIWISEVGAPTCGPGKSSPVDAQPFADRDYMSEAAQQTILSRILEDSKSASFIGALLVYEIRDDNSDDPTTRENCFGIFRSDNSPKPVFSAFRTR